MPPKKFKSMESHTELSEAGLKKFPFQVGDEVEMRSFENGYRGAWFRVKIKKIRKDSKNKILCSMGYKDYSDESEEEIYAFETDPATNELSLMIRPTPPLSVKESNFHKGLDTKSYVVYRDEWEVGDLVDWWYHNCWWAAKVTLAVGNSKFQILCPAPPNGEGGMYMANSRDLRPSLKWEKTSLWSAPPSKEIGKQPCARIVRIEAAELSASNQRRGLQSQRRGRPKVTRRFPLPRKEIPFPGGERGHFRVQRVMELADLQCDRPLPTQQALSSPNRSTLSKLDPTRERTPKGGSPEEEVKKRKKPISIKVIYPREDHAYEKISRSMPQTMRSSHTSMQNSTRAAEKPRLDRENRYESPQTDTDASPSNEEGNHHASENLERSETLQDGGEYNTDGDEADGNETVEDTEGEDDAPEPTTQAQDDPYGVSVPRWCRTVNPLPCPRSDVSRETDPQMSDRETQNAAGEKKRWTKQRRSVIYIPCKSTAIRENLFSNGHSQDLKRRKLDHIRRPLDVEHARNLSLGAEASAAENVAAAAAQSCDSMIPLTASGLRNDLTRVRSKGRRKQKKFGGPSVRKSMLLNCVDNSMLQRMGNIIPASQMALPGSLPLLDGGHSKEVGADEVAGEQQHFALEGQNQELQSDLFGSSFMMNPEHGESLIDGIEAHLNVSATPKETEEELKESQILKVLSAYQEAFTDRNGLDVSSLYSSNDLETYQDSIMREESCSKQQKEDLSGMGMYEDHFTKDMWAPRVKSCSLSQETAPLKTKQSKPWEVVVPKSHDGQDKHLTNFRVSSSPRKGFQDDVELRNKLFEDRDAKESAVDFHHHDVDLSHELAIRREASSLDTISGGGSQELFSGRWGNVRANVPADVATKQFASGRGTTAFGVEEVSVSVPSLNFSPADLGCPEKNEDKLRLSTGPGALGSKPKKSKKELLCKRKWNGDPIRIRKVRLSRKLIKLARKRKISDIARATQ